jgi:hypothetical protein
MLREAGVNGSTYDSFVIVTLLLSLAVGEDSGLVEDQFDGLPCLFNLHPAPDV